MTWIASTQETFKRAHAHKGSSLVEIYQNCNVFNDGAFGAITKKDKRDSMLIQLTHGEPIVLVLIKSLELSQIIQVMLKLSRLPTLAKTHLSSMMKVQKIQASQSPFHGYPVGLMSPHLWEYFAKLSDLNILKMLISKSRLLKNRTEMVTCMNYFGLNLLGLLIKVFFTYRTNKTSAELLRREFVTDHQEAVRLVSDRQVKVNGSFALNVNQLVKQSDNIVLATPPKQFVKRGEKLAHAIQSFGIAVDGANCIDIGSSTGGSPTAYCNEERNESPVSMSDMGFSMKKSCPIDGLLF